MTADGQQIRRRDVDTAALARLGDLHPVMQRIYAARGVASADELETALTGLAPPSALSGMDAVVAEIVAAIVRRESILVVGDFDADGATSCALALIALRAMGAAQVDYLVPNRFDYGYGLSPEIVAEAQTRRPDLLVTVDNGVSSVDGVRAARELGMRVVVTDHHLPPDELPEAHGIVNPNLPHDAFPSKHLAGVGVVFYVMAAVRQALREQGVLGDEEAPRLAELLDLVALGTVADVVPLDRNNRILIDQGVRRIRHGHCRAGIRALLEVAGRETEHCIASDLAFAVAPRLNAAGRLEDIGVGIECLLAEDAEVAWRLARQLDTLNQKRRVIEDRMQEQALEAVEATQANLPTGSERPPAICVTDSGWHQGVVGIVASRLKERFQCPVVAFAPVADGELKGSGRSVPGLHLRDIMERIATNNPGMIKRFGGHAAAAGLTLYTDKLEDFRLRFLAEVRENLGEDSLAGVWFSDGELSGDALNLELAGLIRNGGPWGQGFPEPRFDGCFQVLESRVVGARHLKLRVSPGQGQQPVDAIAFRAVDAGWDSLPESVHMVYRVDINRWRGKESLQLIVEHLAPALGAESSK